MSKSAKPFETVNSTRSTPMLKRLAETDSVWLAVQEHHVPRSGVDTMAAKVRKLGFKFCATGATYTGNSEGGTSGGAAVCVKSCYGVKMLFGIKDANQPWTIVPGRAAGVRVQGIIRGGIVVISVYLRTGE